MRLGVLSVVSVEALNPVALALAIAVAATCAPKRTLSPDVVYRELVDEGCLAPAPDGPDSVAQAMDAGKDEPPWLSCLASGGTVAGCAVPCSGPAP